MQRIFWDKERLAEAGIEQISGEKYTTEIHDKNSETSVEPWLIVFTKDLASENPYDQLTNINTVLSIELLKLRKLTDIKIGYIDIYGEDGAQLLKETFDID